MHNMLVCALQYT